MIQSSPVFPALVEDIECIRLYVEKLNTPLVSELQQYVAATEFQFDIVLLSSALADNDKAEQSSGGALLVACDSQEDALNLTEEYALLEQPVHWLIENTFHLQNNQPVSYTHLRSPRDRTRSRMPSSA